MSTITEQNNEEKMQPPQVEDIAPLSESDLTEQIQLDLAEGLIDEAIAKQRLLPSASTAERLKDYARLRAGIAEKLAAQGRAAGVLDVLQPYDTAVSRVRLPVQERAIICLRLGEAYCATLNQPSSVALLDEAIRYAGKAGDKFLEATARSNLGLVYFYLGEYVIAQEQLRAALEFFTSASDKRGEAQVHLYFGLVFTGLGEFAASIENYNKAITLAEEIGDEMILAEGKIHLGTAFLLQGKLRQAISLYESTIEDYEKKGRIRLAIQTYNNLAYGMILCGNLIRADQLLEKSLVLARQNQDDYGEAMALGQFGLLYMYTGRIQTAGQTLNFSIELAKQIHARDCESFSKINLGRVLLSMGEIDAAVGHLQDGLDIANAINRIGFAIEAEMLLIESHLMKKEFDQAEEKLQQAHKLLARQPNFLLDGKLMRVEARIAVARGDGKALQLLTRALEIFEAYSHPLEKALCLMDRALILGGERESIVKACVEMERAAELFEKLGASQLAAAARIHVKELSGRLPKAAEGGSVRECIGEERRRIQRLIRACRSREQLFKEAVDILHKQYLADAVAVYEIDSERDVKFVAASSELTAMKTAIDRRVQNALSEKKHGWLEGRKFDESIYLDVVSIDRERRLATVVWFAPRKLIQADMVHSFMEIAGEMAALAAQQEEQRRVEVDEDSKSGRLKSFKGLPELIFASRKMSELTEQVLRIHSSDLTVLITGESGTGKDLVARAIHSVSERGAKPFVPFNCTATPREIVEAQLFGYRKGSFTGANIDYEGVIRAANGGTLLLDEIGDVDLSVQPKLLRFLQEGEIQPLGYSRPMRVDVRVIASTNRELSGMVERGEFREDLYHRLNIIRLSVSPLRQRRDEIALLALYFLKQSCLRTGKRLSFSPEVLLLFESFDWPGNVRQLKNEIERIVAFALENDLIEKLHLSQEIIQATANLKLHEKDFKEDVVFAVKPGLKLQEIMNATEREVIIKAIKQCRGNIRRTAGMLGISRKGLYDKIKRLKIKYAG